MRDARLEPEKSRVNPWRFCAPFTATIISVFDFNHSADINAYTSSGTSQAPRWGGSRSCSIGRDPALRSTLPAPHSLRVRLHMACQSLRANECRMAVRRRQPDLGQEHSPSVQSMGMLATYLGAAKDVRCAGRWLRAGKGCGIVLLKRLSDALVEAIPSRRSFAGTAQSTRTA